ncbi:MAG: right-handed parallel beta-helix repeat-containing protein [Sedimentisphaerales bacterium]|nr:right-handed parallel beta-helix repeat-containing protein [Sedimentisphaerales bacterium]
MLLRKKTITILFVIIFVVIIGTVQAGKSIYVISNTYISEVQAYDINDANLSYKQNYICELDPPGIMGAVGIAVDESPYGAFLFVTFEESDDIELINAKSMQQAGTVTAPGAQNLAGVAVDASKSKLYAVDRYTNHLYSYSWNPLTKILTPDFNSPYYVELEDISNEYGKGAFGIALDEENGLLYVADNTNDIKYYKTVDWSKAGQIDDVSCNVISIAIDVENQLLYYGSMGSYGQGDLNLYQYGLSSYIEDSNNVGCSVAGIVVDQQSSLIYLTTYGGSGDTYYPDPPEDRLMIYNSSLVKQSWESGDIGNPAGITVAGVGYKPPGFSITKDDNDIDCVYPYKESDENWLYYNIHWDADGFADTNVTVTDFLPIAVDEPNWISDNGVYDGNFHIVKWGPNDISGNDSGVLTIRCKVNGWAQPCGTITDIAEIEGDNYYGGITTIDTNVCPWGGEIVYVDKDATGFNNGTSWDDAYLDLQDALANACNCGPAIKYIWVAEGVYKPVSLISVSDYQDYSFELLDDVYIAGHFGGIGTYETNSNQRNLADANNTTILQGRIGDKPTEAVQYIVKAENIDDAIVDGFTIQNSHNGAGIYLDNSEVGITNCIIQDNNEYGLYAEHYSNPDIHNCIFFNTGICHIRGKDHSYPEISYSIIDGNSFTRNGLIVDSYSTADIGYCIFKNNMEKSVSANGATMAIAISTFINNSIDVCDCDIYLHNNADLTIDKSVIDGSGDRGLLMASGCDLEMTDCIIRNNKTDGIRLQDNQTTAIKNCWIYNNGGTGSDPNLAGIDLSNHSANKPTIFNNTIYNNNKYGIYVSEYGGEPNILNCIIYGNTTDDLYRDNEDFENVNFCLLQNQHFGTGNKVGDPCFFDSENNNLHIKYESICRNAGSPGNYAGQTDIDGEPRLAYGTIDIGADEYYWSKADYDIDEIVDFIDYSRLAGDWKTVPSSYSLDTDNDIDIYDLDLFSCDWLWTPAWGSEPFVFMMGAGSDSSDEGRATSDVLMLTSISDSIATQPARLAAKTKKYYELTTYNTVLAIQGRLAEKEKFSDVDIKVEINVDELLDWWDKLWQSGDLADWTYDDYLDFRDAIKSSD